MAVVEGSGMGGVVLRYVRGPVANSLWLVPPPENKIRSLGSSKDERARFDGNASLLNTMPLWSRN